MLKLASYTADGQAFWGAATDQGMIALNTVCPEYAGTLDVIKAGALSQVLAKAEGMAVTHPCDTYSYDVPIPNAPRILCVGVNFPNRNEEYKDGQDLPPYPSLFPRFVSGFTGHGQPLVRPLESEKLDYEGEIAIVIGKEGRRIAREQAWDHIAAVTLCNEGTIRDWVRHAKFNVTQGKNWDRSAALGPYLVPFTDKSQLEDVRLTTHVNGELRQEDRTGRMIFPIDFQIHYISTFMTLQPGDIIVTGTPTGAGARFDPPKFLKPGDEIVVAAEGIGELRNGVADEA